MRGGARSCAGRREKGASESVKYYRDTSEQVKCYGEILQGYKSGGQMLGGNDNILDNHLRQQNT